jgi:hypothetical protein
MTKNIYTNCFDLKVGCKVYADKDGKVYAQPGKYSDGTNCYTVNSLGTITEFYNCGDIPTTTTTTSTTTTSTTTTSTTTTTTTSTTTTTTAPPPPSVLYVFGYMEPCIGGTIDDYMGAAVYMDTPPLVDTQFEVIVQWTSPGASCNPISNYTQALYVTVPSGSQSSNFNACNNGYYISGGATICNACINTCDNPAVDFSAVSC